jgi:NADH-quinone oxidoreductase subunit H
MVTKPVSVIGKGNGRSRTTKNDPGIVTITDKRNHNFYMLALFHILIFPGFLFLCVFGLFAQFLDRKIYARLQNRIGPPWFQPFADLIKLAAKEEIAPSEANLRMFRAAPLFALTSVTVSIIYIPLWHPKALYSFGGDIIAVLYLMNTVTLAFFVGGWYSTSLYARIGSVRTITQLFAYEVPLFMGILAPAMLADTWSISEMAIFYNRHPGYWAFNLIGFAVSLVALLGKLEKVPFDIPEAETEIVAGAFTEYSGRLLAILRLTIDIEMVVGASAFWGFFLYLAKVLLVVFLLSFARTIFARMRIDQMINFCWKYVAPLALLQIIINLFVKIFLIG